jgi:hypothetical protein
VFCLKNFGDFKGQLPVDWENTKMFCCVNFSQVPDAKKRLVISLLEKQLPFKKSVEFESWLVHTLFFKYFFFIFSWRIELAQSDPLEDVIWQKCYCQTFSLEKLPGLVYFQLHRSPHLRDKKSCNLTLWRLHMTKRFGPKNFRRKLVPDAKKLALKNVRCSQNWLFKLLPV